MTIRCGVLPLGTLALAALAACGGGGSSGSGPANARAFCMAVADAEESTIARCQGRNTPLIFPQEWAVNCQGFQDAQDAGRIAFDATKATACLDTLRSWSCADYQANFGGFGNVGMYTSSMISSAPPTCQEAVAPQVASGGACYSVTSIECMGGYCNMTATQCFSGGATCATWVPPNGDCTSGRCAPGYVCSSNECVAEEVPNILGQGWSCAGGSLCEDGLYCDPSKTCSPRARAGEDCTSVPCLEGLSCKSNVCMSPKLAGAACLKEECAVGLFCSDASVCTPYPREGQSCAQITGGDIVLCADSWCNAANTCEAYLAPGSACDPNLMALSSFLSCGMGYTCFDAGLSGPLTGRCGQVYCLPE